MHLPKIIHIDLSSNKKKEIEIPEEIFRKYIGGRGLANYIYMKYIGNDIDPLDEGNGMVFMTGPLVGTIYPTATRISLVSRSPLTNTISSSNMGGNFGKTLKQTGYDGLLLTGKVDTLSYLHFNGGEFKIVSAEKFKGETITNTEKNLSKEYPRSSILSIGPAGENMVRFACIGSMTVI